MPATAIATTREIIFDTVFQETDQVALTILENGRQHTRPDGFTPQKVGFSLLIARKTRPSGRVSYSASASYKFIARRNSGKVYTYWVKDPVRVITRTKAGRLMITSFEKKGKVITRRPIFVTKEAAEEFAGYSTEYDSYLNPQTEAIRWVDSALSHTYSTSTEGAPGRRDYVNAHAEQMLARIVADVGTTPTLQEVYPLLTGRDKDLIRSATLGELSYAPAWITRPWEYSQTPREVAEKLFGKTRYRKQLTRLVMTHDPAMLAWFSLYRGLVPIEWIIDRLTETPPRTRIRDVAYGTQADTVRSILRALPHRVLRRVLTADFADQSIALIDSAVTMRDGGIHYVTGPQLTEAIQARGARNVRTPAEVEAIIRALARVADHDAIRPEALRRSEAASAALIREVNQRQEIHGLNRERLRCGLPELTLAQLADPVIRAREEERMRPILEARRTEQERLRLERDREEQERRVRENAEQAAWTAELTAGLRKAGRLGQYPLDVADSAIQLVQWGQRMGHCIGDYDHRIKLDVFVELRDPQTSKPLVHMQIRNHDGIAQCYGGRNKPADQILDEDQLDQIFDQLAALGVHTEYAGGLGGYLQRRRQRQSDVALTA